MTLKILLVEKDEDTRANWKELLRIFKYDVRSVGGLSNVKNPSELLTKYFTAIEVVVADTDAVGVDGLALKQVLNNDFSRIPVILCSADNVPEYSLDREELSGVAFLRKPFDNSLLLEYVSKAQKFKQLIEEDLDTQKAIAKLHLIQPQNLPIEIALKRSYTLGRYRDSDEFHADIRLSSASASRKHAFLIRIYKGRESYYKLIDFSSNGILINGRRMAKMQRLNHQDEITFYPGSKAIYTEIAREDNDLDTTLTSSDG